MRKPDFCLCKNKDADQLCSNCTADQRLCFRYSDSTIPLLPLPKISRFQHFSETIQVGNPEDRFPRVAAPINNDINLYLQSTSPMRHPGVHVWTENCQEPHTESIKNIL